MTVDSAGEQFPAHYELTIAGALGPVLRLALQPHDVRRSEACTIMLAGASPGRDLVDLLGILDDQGLRVEGVFTVG